MRAFHRLSARAVQQLQKPGRHADGSNLYLEISDSGNKHWIFRYRAPNGKEQYIGLGAYHNGHTITLARARELAQEARIKVAAGVDLKEEKRAQREKAKAAPPPVTFEQAAREYFEAKHNQWRNAKHRAQFLSTLEAYAFPVIGKRLVSEIDTEHVLDVLKPIWDHKTETASRVRGRIEKVLDWAKFKKLREGDNPALWKGHLDNQLTARSKVQKTVHHPALAWEKAPAFYAELRKREAVAARALEFIMLTAARTGEVIGARWDEIDYDGVVTFKDGNDKEVTINTALWTIPAARMKMGEEHRVPLSDEAVALLQKLPREKHNPFVFIGGPRKGLSNMAMARLLERMDRRDITVHGMRSTFRNWAAEATSFPNHIAEMALAHKISDKVEAAYRRGDLLAKRIPMMQRWSTYLHTPPKIERYRPASLAAE